MIFEVQQLLSKLVAQLPVCVCVCVCVCMNVAKGPPTLPRVPLYNSGSALEFLN